MGRIPSPEWPEHGRMDGGRGPSRVYPVTVDPSFTASGTTYVMYPDTMDDSVYDDLLVGTWDNGGQIGNSFLAFSGLGSTLAGEQKRSRSSSCSPSSTR